MSDIQPGPCVVCGLRNYGLSYGGPTICPACDAGYSGPSRMNAQRERIADLEAEAAALREALEWALPYAEEVAHQYEMIGSSDRFIMDKVREYRVMMRGHPLPTAADVRGILKDEPEAK